MVNTYENGPVTATWMDAECQESRRHHLWTKARNAKGHYSCEQKGSGKRLSLCFHLSRCWACADAEWHPVTASPPCQLPWKGTAPGTEAAPSKQIRCPAGWCFYIWLSDQPESIQRPSGDRWSFWCHFKHSTGSGGHLQHVCFSVLPSWPALKRAQCGQLSLHIVRRILGLEELVKVYSIPFDAPAASTTKLSFLTMHDASRDMGLRSPSIHWVESFFPIIPVHGYSLGFLEPYRKV